MHAIVGIAVLLLAIFCRTQPFTTQGLHSPQDRCIASANINYLYLQNSYAVSQGLLCTVAPRKDDTTVKVSMELDNGTLEELWNGSIIPRRSESIGSNRTFLLSAALVNAQSETLHYERIIIPVGLFNEQEVNITEISCLEVNETHPNATFSITETQDLRTIVLGYHVEGVTQQQGCVKSVLIYFTNAKSPSLSTSSPTPNQTKGTTTHSQGQQSSMSSPLLVTIASLVLITLTT